MAGALLPRAGSDRQKSRGAESRTVRIGGASGYWGDSSDAPRQLVLKGDIDYLVFDYLAEVTMSILVRARAKDPSLGYARDFVELVMKPLAREIKDRNIKVIVNSGGVNVQACAQAVAEVTAGTGLTIGTVEGDDLMPRIDELRAVGTTEMFSGAPLPEKVVSANAYLGAFPIAAALEAGADIVITGRCVDSAVTLGPLIYEFGWQATDYDLLAAGTLAGHIIECGAQATGGNFTDWLDVADGWDDMGYPIAECRGDGQFAIVKPAGTGGVVSRLSVGEQILYEIGDPAAYIVPDVVCNFANVSLVQADTNRVEVNGVSGRAPTPTLKVSATYRDGFRATALTGITGFDAVPKAEAFAAALFKRTRRMFTEKGMPDFDETALHLAGAQTLWGANASPDARQAREIVMQIDVRHRDKNALEIFSKETTGVALSMTTGRYAVGNAGRPKVTPVIAQFAFLVDRDTVRPVVCVEGVSLGFCQPDPLAVVLDTGAPPTPSIQGKARPTDAEVVEVPLIELAVARSGDKGNSANIGVMARQPAFIEPIRAALTEQRVKQWFAHVCVGDVIRYEAPGFHAFNFLLTESLGGGGTSSLHMDKQAKSYGQQILAMTIPISKQLLRG